MRHARHVLSSLLLATVAATAPVGRAAGDADGPVVGSDSGFAFAIHAVADYAGSLDPCGCKVPLGGVARRAGYRKDVEQAFAGAPVVPVDAGHMFTSDTSPAEPITGDPAIRNEWVLKALEYVGVRAANVSPYDLPYLATIMKSEGFQARAKAYPAIASFVSANVTPAGPGLQPFAPGFVVEVAGRKADKPIRVAFVGVTAIPKQGATIAGYTIADPVVALRKVVAEMRAKSDVVVLLAYMNKNEIRRVQNGVPGIDVVIAADRYPRAKLSGDLELPATVTVATDGRYVTDLRLHVGPDRRAVRLEQRTVPLDDQVSDDRAAARLANEGRVAAEASAPN